jgi:hypothetical protein
MSFLHYAELTISAWTRSCVTYVLGMSNLFADAQTALAARTACGASWGTALPASLFRGLRAALTGNQHITMAYGALVPREVLHA